MTVEPVEPRVQALRLLLVSGNDNLRRLVRALLRTMGMTRVQETADTAEGYLLARDHSPDVVIVDVDAPGDGVAFVRALREGVPPGGPTFDPRVPEPGVPVLLLTAGADEALVRKAKALGVNGLLVTPLVPRKLHDRLIRIAETRS